MFKVRLGLLLLSISVLLGITIIFDWQIAILSFCMGGAIYLIISGLYDIRYLLKILFN